MVLRYGAGLAALMLFLGVDIATAQMRITEWMYNDSPEEFIEFTNIGAAPIDMNGWSFDDDSRLAGTVSLSAFGIVQPGASVILAEDTATNFRNNWSLPASVGVIGSNATNLGRGDEINLFDSANGLVDRLTYGDQAIPGTIRTLAVSGNPKNRGVLGTNDVHQWQLSFVGDAFGSYVSATGQVGNPGKFPGVPEPGSLVLIAIGAVAALWPCRRK